MAGKKSKTEATPDKAVEETSDASEVQSANIADEIPADAHPEPDAIAEGEAADQEEVTEPEDESADFSTEQSAPRQKVDEGSGGFFPMVLGGLVAAGIGFGSALYLLPQLPESWLPDSETSDLAAKLDAQGKEISDVKRAVDEATENSDLSAALEQAKSQIGSLRTDIEKIKSKVTEIDGLSARLTTLEKAPMADATPEAVAAYQREMAALQEVLAAQRADVEAMAKEAEAKRASAEMTAQEALKRSALSQILTSLETGSGFSEAVDSLQSAGVSVPEALSAQSAGVPSIEALKESYPEVARAALAAARTENGGGGFSSFLKTQLGARSLEPREGDDADAVLSRVEAAVKEGRLGDAMAEVSALPDAAKAALADWTDAVKARQAAVDAAEALGQQINSN